MKKKNNLNNMQFFDKYDLQRVKNLLFLSDEELLKYTNYTEYNQKENQKYNGSSLGPGALSNHKLKLNIKFLIVIDYILQIVNHYNILVIIYYIIFYLIILTKLI